MCLATNIMVHDLDFGDSWVAQLLEVDGFFQFGGELAVDATMVGPFTSSHVVASVMGRRGWQDMRRSRSM